MSEYYGENPADCTSAGFFLTFGSTFIRRKVLPKSQARRFWDGRLIPSYRLNFANKEKQIYEFEACALLFILFGIRNALPRGYVELNGLYAWAGSVCPAVEFVITSESTLRSEIVVSPVETLRQRARDLRHFHERIPPLLRGI